MSITPSIQIPLGSRFKGYRDFIVQDLIISSHNTRYRLERWITPQGDTVKAELPVELGGRHFGPELVRFIVYQYHHCQTTQPLLLEQLREYGIDISAGQIERILSKGHEQLHEEKDALLKGKRLRIDIFPSASRVIHDDLTVQQSKVRTTCQPSRQIDESPVVKNKNGSSGTAIFEIKSAVAKRSETIVNAMG